MRDPDIANVLGLDANRGERRRQALRPVPGLLERANDQPVRERCDGVADPGIPQQISLAGVMNEIAIVRQIDRNANIDARRPERLVGGMRPTAIENIEAVDCARARGRAGAE